MILYAAHIARLLQPQTIDCIKHGLRLQNVTHRFLKSGCEAQCSGSCCRHLGSANGQGQSYGQRGNALVKLADS